MSPTARSLKYLRSLGYAVDIVERWIARAGVRRDLFHCIDLVAVKACESGVLGIQATSIANISARVKKAVAIPELETWLKAGNRFQVFGWCKRRSTWEVKVVEVNGADMQPTVVCKPSRRRHDRHQQGELFSAMTEAS
jgi:hypothetical protein